MPKDDSQIEVSESTIYALGLRPMNERGRLSASVFPPEIPRRQSNRSDVELDVGKEGQKKE